MNRKDRRKHKSIQNNSLLIREFMHAYNYHEKGMLEEAKLEYKKILLNHPDQQSLMIFACPRYLPIEGLRRIAATGQRGGGS